ncbi:MAG: type II secretion system F family protein [Patescibacteria group bacterium]
MSIYNYRVKKADDEFSEGLVEAESESIAVDILEQRGLRVLFLEEKRRSWATMNIVIERIKAKDLVIFSRQLSILISAQVPVTAALKDVIEQTNNKKFKKIIAEVASQVEGGIKLSEALAHFPKIFDNFFVNIVKSGEVSGRLEEVLLYLADQVEKDYDLQSKIRGAMIYPAFIIISLVVIGVLMMAFVVPKLIEMLAQSGAELPLSTKILKGISDFVVELWWLKLIVVVGAIIVGYYGLKTAIAQRILDQIKLRLPVFGKLFNYVAIVKFSRGLRTLILGGVDLVSALEVTALMVDNTRYRELIQKTKKTVENGGKLGEVFEKDKLMPKMVSQMLSTGEETGRVEMTLDKLAQFYSREVNNLIANLMSLLEPFIMIVLGVAVALMIAAIILPMYQVSTNM